MPHSSVNAPLFKPDRWRLQTPRGIDFRESYRPKYPWYKWMAIASGPTMTVIGLMGLVGWFLEIPFFKTPVGSWITMKANTALAIVLLGIAWNLLSVGLLPNLTRAALTIVSVLSVLNLWEYITGINLGIDQLLVQDPGGPGTIYPGRMAVPTAVSFILMSIAGFAALSGNHRLAQWPLLVSLVTGLFYLQLLLFRGHSFLEHRGYTNMAFNTALSICIASVGGLCMWPYAAPMRRLFANDFCGFVLRRLVPVAIILPTGLGLFRLHGEISGWFDLGFGVSLITTGNVVLLVLMLWKSGGLIDKIDIARRRNEESVAEAEEFARAAINSLAAHIAIVNQAGVVEAVNNRWPELANLFSQQGLDIQPGTNYVEACRNYLEGQEPRALIFAAGLESVLNGSKVHYSMEYVMEHACKRKYMLAEMRPFQHHGQTYAIIAHEDITAMRTAQDELESAYHQLEVARAHDLEEAELEIIERLATAAEFRDDETGKHTARVGELAASVARELSMSTEEIMLLRRAAPLHDVGKIAIPDSILRKPGRLTNDETVQMQQHAEIGARLLGKSMFPLVKMAATIARTHHEKWDGTGYPQGLAGESIPLVGRIVAIVDVYDALTSARPYKEPWSHERALQEIEAQTGKHFDPAVVTAFLRITAAAY